MEGIMYGYMRVSAKDQNEDRQRIALQDFGVEKNRIFLDKQSGKDFQRPAYNRVVRKLKADGRLRRVGPDKGGHWEVAE